MAQKVLTPQEQRMVQGQKHILTSKEPRINRVRVKRILEGFRDKPPRVSVDRARLYTESFKQTEGLPMVMRVAKALGNIMSKIDIFIGDDELIVGHCGPLGKLGVLYPEFRGCWLEKSIKELGTRREGKFILTEEDIRVINEEILPYWKGKTIHEAYINLLPEDTRRLFFEEDTYTSKGVIDDLGTNKAAAEWVPDWGKVVKKGFNGIKREAEERLASLNSLDLQNDFDKVPFLKAVIIVCDAMVTFAKRYAQLARNMAQKETSKERKRELLEIADTCEWVPGNPARTFREAIQSHWFGRVGSHFESEGTGYGNGRLDQLLYPYYEKDLKEGRITKDEALELLECHWVNQAQYLRMFLTGSISSWEAYSHFEVVTLGGLTRAGRDATNELSYLILQSKIEFPLSHPDIMIRVHSRSPQSFLMKACECVKEGMGFPKFINDEEIIPAVVSEGATWEEAFDYSGSGCSEVRMPNRDSYHAIGPGISLPAALDMALNDGVFRLRHERMGVRTGDPRGFTTFGNVMNAFSLQLENLIGHCFIRQTTVDLVRRDRLAGPLLSCLHDLCMQQCVDIFSNKMQGANYSVANFIMTGFGTVVDSLAAVKRLVYDDKKVTMSELLEALDTNFEGKEALRQMCLNAPKYGNNDPYVDSIGSEVEGMIGSLMRKYTNLAGGKVHPMYVPVTLHVTLGRALAATPNGRKAGEALSDGISPSQGCGVNGPTMSLLSVANIKNPRHAAERQSRLLNMKLSPQAVAGDEGTKSLVALLRSWCDLKIWHIQFNVINGETLRDAQKHPEKYRDLLVRVAGYCAYFVDLSPTLQEDIIRRTEHRCI